MAQDPLSPLTEKDRAFIWHPFTQMQTAVPAIPIIRGKGLYLYSDQGTPYMDGISSWWVNLHGHAHPYIVDRLCSQAKLLEHVIFAGFTHPPAIELAARLQALLPGKMAKIFYSDNGSTAVETALKMALQYWHNKNNPRTKIICFKHSYHGDTFGAMSAAGKNGFNKPFWNHLFSVEMLDPPFLSKEEASIQQMQSILASGNAACFIFEPLIMGSGGMLTYSAHGLDQLIRLCKQHQVLCIADEVMTGFGRTSKLFACEQLHEEVDLICLAKGLTGGFLPLGATACTEELYNAFLHQDLSRAFLHGHSYTANPLACASALASLDLLLEDSCTLQREQITNCHKAFCDKWSLHPKLKRCKAFGTILTLEYKAENSSYFQPIRDILYHFFLNKGILLRPLGNVLYVMPPYCIQAEELQFIYEQIIFTLENPLW